MHRSKNDAISKAIWLISLSVYPQKFKIREVERGPFCRFFWI